MDEIQNFVHCLTIIVMKIVATKDNVQQHSAQNVCSFHMHERVHCISFHFELNLGLNEAGQD